MGRHRKSLFLLVLLLWAMASCANSFNYSDALGNAILFLEGQRSGKLPADQRVTWRGDSALNDGHLDGVDLSGGYYDAGDNIKFGWPMSFTVSLLSLSALEYPPVFSSTGQIDYLRTAIKWASDFVLKAHASPTTLYTQVGDASDHYCWERPEDMDTARTLTKVTESNPGTEPVAEAAAALASASIVFKSVSSSYSDELLTAAKSLFDFANNHRGSYQSSCPFYCSFSGYEDELLWAATWLFKATNDTQYLTFISDNVEWSDVVPEFSWDNKFVGVQTLMTKEYLAGNDDLAKYKKDADSYVCALMPGSGSVKIQTTPGGLLFTRDTVNLQYASSDAMMLLLYARILDAAGVTEVQCNSANFTTSQIKSFGKQQVDYILGDNPMKMSYMVGFGGDAYPKRIHHRGASIPSIKTHPTKVACGEGFAAWYQSSEPNPNVHVGAIIGGPGSGDQFNDVRSDANHLEPTTYMNAAFLGAVAGVMNDQTNLEMTGARAKPIKS